MMRPLKFCPTEGNLIIQNIEKKQDNGLIVPETNSSEFLEGKIAAVSDEDDCEIFNVGKKVLYKKNSAKPFEMDNEQYFFLEIKNVVAVENPKLDSI